jgi:hypothetical protein
MKVNIPQAMVVILILFTLVYTEDVHQSAIQGSTGQHSVRTPEPDTAAEVLRATDYPGRDSTVDL